MVENINISITTNASTADTKHTDSRAIDAKHTDASTADTSTADTSTADTSTADARAKLVGVKFSKSLYIFLFYYVMFNTIKNRGKKNLRERKEAEPVKV